MLFRSDLVDVGINYDVNGTGLSVRSGGVVEMTMNVNFGGAALLSSGGYARHHRGLLGRRNNRSGRGRHKTPLDCKSFY